jgi:dTDP-4-dehydrorhamnose reductase
MSESLSLRSKRVLVTGAGGMLGLALLPVLRDAGAAVVGLWRSTPIRVPGIESCRCDLTDPAETARVTKEARPDWVIHAAALTDVGLCEREPALAQATNVEASAHLAAAVHEIGARLAYISSEAVYGEGAEMHRETDPCQPLSEYARTKLAGESAVREEVPGVLVIRTTLVGLAPDDRRSLVSWLLDSFRERKAVNGFRDAFFSPLFAADFSRFLVEAMTRSLVGIWNIGAADVCSKFDFAHALAQALGYDANLVQPGLLREAVLSGQRCYQAALDSGRFQQSTGCVLPTVLKGVSDFAAQKTSAPISV